MHKRIKARKKQAIITTICQVVFATAMIECVSRVAIGIRRTYLVAQFFFQGASICNFCSQLSWKLCAWPSFSFTKFFCVPIKHCLADNWAKTRFLFLLLLHQQQGQGFSLTPFSGCVSDMQSHHQAIHHHETFLQAFFPFPYYFRCTSRPAAGCLKWRPCTT